MITNNIKKTYMANYIAPSQTSHKDIILDSINKDQKPTNKDVVDISSILKPDDKKAKYLEQQSILDLLKDVGNAEEVEIDDSFMKCMTIASRIMAGDKVPMSDEKFLLEHESNMYMVAVSMRTLKKNPKEHKSILEEEAEVGEEESATSTNPEVSEIVSEGSEASATNNEETPA